MVVLCVGHTLYTTPSWTFHESRLLEKESGINLYGHRNVSFSKPFLLWTLSPEKVIESPWKVMNQGPLLNHNDSFPNLKDPKGLISCSVTLCRMGRLVLPSYIKVLRVRGLGSN